MWKACAPGCKNSAIFLARRNFCLPLRLPGVAEIPPGEHDGIRISNIIPPEVEVKRTVALLAICFSVGAVTASAAGTKINGWISDSMCGAKHAGSGAACVKKCVEGGMQPVFVDQSKKEVWKIDNPDKVKGFYGDHVTISATADAANKTVHIDSIAEAK